ncbi:dienelactone hydrolase family protein [Nonomuraea dietziae]|uniref:dienelactone hydrolase family protein n=1 Tax=Nonomuraea dietziae TaxID=65515 RepID=UPI0031D6464E
MSPQTSAPRAFRAAGTEVVTPDLYAGETATTIDRGFVLVERIGWEVIVERAREAVRTMPADTVLAGVSMGTGVVGDLLADRPDTAGVLLLHAIARAPHDGAGAGLPVQVHVADPDVFAPPAAVAALEKAATGTGVDLRVFTYPGVGHFYTDASLPDHDRAAADLTWRRSLDFLRHL